MLFFGRTTNGSLEALPGSPEIRRAEDLAAEDFWKLWRNRKAQGPKAGGWFTRRLFGSR
jgi:hypothetical protein